MFSPVIAYKNKWPSEWTSYWFYLKVSPDSTDKISSIMAKKIENLPKVCPSFDMEEKPEHQAFVAMIREVSKVFGTRDLTEECVAC